MPRGYKTSKNFDRILILVKKLIEASEKKNL